MNSAEFAAANAELGRLADRIKVLGIRISETEKVMQADAAAIIHNEIRLILRSGSADAQPAAK